MKIGPGKRFFCLLCSLVFLYVVSTLIFARGFLLTRSVLNQNSSCVVDFTLPSDNHGEKGCWVHKKFNKAIIIVIDALKYDFIQYNSSQEVTSPPYKNKLKSVHNLLSHHPTKSRLYKFVADPPTTTLQRLKGLTTGSLPTFIDAGANFDSPEINEDNILDQFIQNGRKIKFMGDDTWTGLFPNRFSSSFPFPSFNVKDLHTVDNGILKELIPEMRKDDWHILIAHFLGVDHVGHRFGPNHQAMADKLTQMDDMIRNVTLRMNKDTILFVMGDHGMTKTGDHGGESVDELEAGLFVYSPSQLISSHHYKDENSEKIVSQIDFVPTLSLLMGIPVPFSNLGMIIPELFNYCSWWKTEGSQLKQIFHVIEALRANALQVSHYVNTYSQLTGEFQSATIRDLQDMLDYTESQVQHLVSKIVQHGESEDMIRTLTELQENYITYVQGVRKMFQENWVKFDLVSISIGILLFFSILILNVYMWQEKLCVNFPPSLYVAVTSSSVAVICAVLQIYVLQNRLLPFMAVIVVVISGVINSMILKNAVMKPIKSYKESQKTHANSKGKPIKPQAINVSLKYPGLKIIAVLICVILIGSFFSNSFVVNEDSLTVFFTQSLILSTVYSVIFKHTQGKYSSEKDVRNRGKSFKFDFMRYFTDKSFIFIFYAFISMVLLRLSAMFRVCREEQWNCELSIFVQPLTNFAVKGYKNQRYFFSVACMTVFYLSVRRLLSQNGNLAGDSFLILCFKFIFPVLCVCCCLFWALLGLPVNILDTLPTWQHIIMPWIVYVSVFFAVVLSVLKPLFIHQVSQNPDKMNLQNLNVESKQIIPQVYNHLKKRFQDKVEEMEKPPLLFGLATVYSSSVIVLTYTVLLVLFLLLGDGISPGLMAGLVSLGFYLEVYSQMFPNVDLRLDEEPFNVPWSAVTTVGCLMSACFYSTGHQATLSNIQWVAAFTGFHGDFQVYFIPAFLISLNTFASHVAFSFAMPLLLFWPYCRSHRYRKPTKSSEDFPEDEQSKGEFTLFEHEETFKESLFRLCIKWIFFSSLKLFGTMTAAALHRRHLMVWKVFAIRFVFEAIGTFIIFFVTMLMFLYVMRIDTKLSKFIQRLTI